MLDRYKGECMVSMYNINHGIQNLSEQNEKDDTSQVLIIGGYHRM